MSDIYQCKFCPLVGTRKKIEKHLYSYHFILPNNTPKYCIPLKSLSDCMLCNATIEYNDQKLHLNDFHKILHKNVGFYFEARI